MAYKLIYSSSAEDDLSKIGEKSACSVLKKMDYFLSMEDPLLKAKKLKCFDVPTYRFRVGDYRVVFRIGEDGKTFTVLIVLRVVHRKDAYKKLS